MTSDMQKSLTSARWANIGRYQRLLRTYLTENERKFIERRLAEEQKALMDIAQKAALPEHSKAAWTEPFRAA